jgi:hypothetical protein
MRSGRPDADSPAGCGSAAWGLAVGENVGPAPGVAVVVPGGADTSTVPTIVGWRLQKYSTVPGSSKVTVNVSPVNSWPLSSNAVSTRGVTVCWSWSDPIVQVTEPPAAIVTRGGWKAKPSTRTSAATGGGVAPDAVDASPRISARAAIALPALMVLDTSPEPVRIARNRSRPADEPVVQDLLVLQG